jgi:hypothetical protein
MQAYKPATSGLRTADRLDQDHLDQINLSPDELRMVRASIMPQAALIADVLIRAHDALRHVLAFVGRGIGALAHRNKVTPLTPTSRAPCMSAFREKRGSGLIEAGALDLHEGSHWQPWLRLARGVGGVCSSNTVDRLKPVFGTEQAALRYAAELGRNLLDEPVVLRSGAVQAQTRAVAASLVRAMHISLPRRRLTDSTRPHTAWWPDLSLPRRRLTDTPFVLD